MRSDEILVWLENVKQVLFREGFADMPLSISKPGQVFGLAKNVDPHGIWEMRIRGFTDGHLEAEIKITREYLQHLDERGRKATVKELTNILDSNFVLYNVIQEQSQIVHKVEPPKTFTEWKPLAIIGIMTIGARAVAVHINEKRKRKSNYKKIAVT